MKLSDSIAKRITTKQPSPKSRIVKILAATALAAAALTVAAPAASAQGFAVGFGFGGPRYYAPPPPVYYGGYGYHHRDWRFYHPYHRYGWYR